MAEPLFIDAAINGVVRKGDNPNVPRSTEEIRADVAACFDAGASVVHPHEPDGAAGPTDAAAYAKCWEPILDERPWAMLYPTVGNHGTNDERYGHIVELATRGMLRIG